jgi:hypothetical protein
MALDGPEYTDTWFSLLFSGLVSKVSLARKLRWASFPNGPGFAAFLAILLLMPAFRKSRLVSTVIEELTKAGKFREAIVVTDTVFQEWFWRASEFERIAKAAAEAGDFVHAELAAGLIPAESAGGRDHAYCGIVRCLTESSNISLSERFEKAWEITDRINDNCWISFALNHICRMFIRAGDPDQARRIALAIPDFSGRVSALQNVGFAYLKASHLGDAETVLRLMRGQTCQLFRQSFRTSEEFHQRFLDSQPPYASPNWDIFEMGQDVGACAIAAMEMDSLAMELVKALIDRRPQRAFRIAKTFISEGQRDIAIFFYKRGHIEMAVALYPPETLYTDDGERYPEIGEAVQHRWKTRWA